MRHGAAELLIAVISTTGAWAAVRPAPKHHRTREYRQKVFNRRAVARSAASAALGTVRNRPHEWGGGFTGFAKRAASSFGTHVAKASIEFGVATIHHENLHYQRSNLQGKWPRLKYAVESTFIVPRTNHKRGKTVAAGRIAGNMGAGMISRLWQPASAAGIGSGLATGGIGLGADVGVNVAREFWPRKHDLRPHGKTRPLR
jgi:hypothetical protein